jgi:hypothetical protein
MGKQIAIRYREKNICSLKYGSTLRFHGFYKKYFKIMGLNRRLSSKGLWQMVVSSIRINIRSDKRGSRSHGEKL